MENVLIVVHLLVVVVLAGTVLLQRSEGGALGMGGGSSGGGFFTGRGQANLLTRTTAILGTLFFVTSLALSMLAGYNRAPTSVIDSVAPAGQTAPSGGLLNQLKGVQNQSAPSAPSSAPSLPVPGGPSTPQN